MRHGDAPLHVQYTQYTVDHTAEYGPRTAVLMLVGSFYEIYGYRLADGNIVGSALTAVATLCDLKIAKKQDASLSATSRLACSPLCTHSSSKARRAPQTLSWLAFATTASTSTSRS